MRVPIVLTLGLALSLSQVNGQDQVKDQPQNCVFPESLKSKPRWETGVVKEHVRTNGYYMFYTDKVEIMDYLSDEQNIVTWQCEQAFDDGKYILKMDHVAEGGNENYVCMQFLERSEYIMQRKVSDVYGVASPDMCSDEKLRLDDWPLVWPEIDDDYSECPFIGGYAFEMREYIHDEPICDDWLKPRLESECIKGEGVKIDFRSFSCKGDLSMDIVQKLSCLGSWDNDKYIFTIMTDQDDLWPKLWLMRITKTPGNDESFKAVLSMDIVADQSEFFGNDGLVPLERIYELVLKTELYPSLCENEAEQCEEGSTMCGDVNSMFCQKECGVCERSQEFHECHFVDDTRGDWQEIREKITKDIKVTQNMLYADDLLPFQCYELYADGWYEGTGRKALATIFQNGCKPRYTCAEFKSRSPDVMTYRLSQSLVWPATLNVNAEDVCNDKVFKNDKAPLEGQYRSRDPKVLVKKEQQEHYHSYVPCKLDTSFGLSGQSNDGTRLLGVLWSSVFGHHEGESSDTLLHETCANQEAESVNPGHAFHSTRMLKCLASYDHSNETQFMVVKDPNNPHNIECWIIHQFDWELDPKIYVLHPSDCNPDTPYQVEFKHTNNYIAKYDLLEIEEDLMDPCSKWLRTTMRNRDSTTPPVVPTLESIQPEIPSGGKPVADGSKSGVPVDWSIRVGGLKSASSQIAGRTWLVGWAVGLVVWAC